MESERFLAEPENLSSSLVQITEATRSSTLGPERYLGFKERRASGQNRPASYCASIAARRSSERILLKEREKRSYELITW
jgi:hypothetical protein